MNEEKLKEVNIYSFNDENYVSLQDYVKLQQENQQLKEQNEKLRTIRVDYECFTENTNLIDDYTKTRLSKNKYLIECSDGNFVDINELETQLKQKDEVIDEAIKKVKVVKEYKFDLIGRYELLKTLQKYKGDNK